MKWLGMAFILLYKRTLSPFIGRSCRYTPTCSMYAYDAIRRYGLFPVPENYRGRIKWLV